jgi:phasin
VSESEVKVGLNGTNGFGMPLLGFPRIAVPGVFGELAKHGVARAQEGCEKIKAASEEMAEALRETYSSNVRSATDYGLKVIEISNANTASGIDFFARLLGSKSVTDVFTLSAAQANKAFDTASAQNKELGELAQKLAAETGEPIRKHVAKVLHQTN